MERRKFFKIVVALALLGALIFFGDSFGIKGLVLRLTGPIFRMAMRINGLGLSQEEINLREESGRLKASVFELEQLKSENAALKKALSFKETSKLPLKGAKVIFYSQESGKEFLLVDQGKEAGIKAGDLVLDTGQALIGRVKEASDGFSKVGVASNPRELFEVEIASLKIRALAKGLGARAFSIDLLPLDTALGKGDFVGFINGDKFLLLAEISGEKIVSGSVFKEARALLAARPELAKEVFIVGSGI